jgi:hypothetical protein
MQRVQLQVTDEQMADLRRHAEASGQPVTALVREAIEDWRDRRRRAELWDRALSVVGRFNSGLGDVAENHDKYLGEGDW